MSEEKRRFYGEDLREVSLCDLEGGTVVFKAQNGAIETDDPFFGPKLAQLAEDPRHPLQEGSPPAPERSKPERPKQEDS